ncbi:MAG TPA: hypothetical protein VMB03_02190 [Bryobacteraceae bacterium]|nr:hypothetical protein [Bryobacteraceae bacterium]
MKSIKLFLLLLACWAAVASAPGLDSVHNVYVLPMAHGLEQYLANILTGEHIFVIVTDPKMADAVLTDHVDSALQNKLDTLLAPPPEPAKGGDKADKDEAPKGSIFEPANKVENPAENSSLGRSRGMVFLVGTKSRQVLWSVYDLPKDSTSKELDRIATVIVSRLKKDMGLTKK